MKKHSPQKRIALTPRQRNILQKLEDYLDIINEYNGYAFKEIDNFRKDPGINEIFTDYQNVLFKSIRANLHNHPLVTTEIRELLLEWKRTHEKLGKKDFLRKVMRGLEVGVKRPLSKEEAELKVAVEELRLRIDAEPAFEMDDSNIITFEDILQEIRSHRKFDPDNPPPIQSVRSWTLVHRILVKRGMVNSTRQVFLRKARRLCPSLFPKDKKK